MDLSKKRILKQRIKLSQSAYFGGHEDFELFRSTEGEPWTIRHYWRDMPMPPRAEDWQDVTKQYNPGWLSRTIEELKILNLKSEDEIKLPSAQVMDGLEFEIEIQQGDHKKEIYYYHYFDFLRDFPDVWRADAFWTLLKHPELEGHGEEE